MRRLVGVEAAGINACPCAQGLVRGRASERLLEAGFDGDEVERIFELVPLATHNQRGRGTLYVGTQASVNAEQLVDIVEGSMSAPVYELLKRPDELFVVEHAHLQPRFVEDSVRLALKGALDAYPELDDADFVFSRQVNLETIHTHDVLAERFGTVGELRRELEHGGPLEHHTRLDEWLAELTVTDCYGRRRRLAAELDPRLGARAQAREVRRGAARARRGTPPS